MTAPYPPHTALLRDTDLAIRRLAEYTDTAMSAAIRLAVLNPTDYVTNASGDVAVQFPTLDKGLTGAILYAAKYLFVNGQTTRLPSGGGVDYIVPARYAWPEIFNTSPPSSPPGSLWVKIMVQPYSVTANETGPWAPLEPAGANQTISLSGIAWGPA